MTQEEKQILLMDLCMRLPYGVICKRYGNAYELVDVDIKRGLVYLLRGEQYVPYSITAGDEIKPYLRPMSSMTEKERKEFDKFCVIDELAWKGGNLQGYINQAEIMRNGIKWLNANHFDYSGLIPMGLAEEAPEGMHV